MHWEAILLAAAWCASTVTVHAPGMPFDSSFGFVAGLLLALGAAAVLLARQRSRFFAVLRQHRAAVLASALLLGAHLVRGLLDAGGSAALLLSLRLGCVLAFGLMFLVARRQAGLREALATVGAGLVALQVGLRLLALVWPAVDEIVMERARHESLGPVLRFVGLSTYPASAGLFALMGVAFAQLLRSKRLRALVAAAGLAMVAATLSIYLVLIPAVVAIGLLRRPRARRIVAALVIAAALGALWVHPLHATVATRHVTHGHLHPSWHEEGLGPAHMPIRRWAFGGVVFEFNETVYAIMARRAVSCFWEHPALGVSPGRFQQACPVTTMNTYGFWSTSRDPHNQYLGWLAELGLLGLAAVLGAVVLMTRRYRLQRHERWQRGVLLAIAFGGMLGPMVLALPSAAFFALQLRTLRVGNGPAGG